MNQGSKSLYRHFIRELGRLAGNDGGRRANLRRLYRPQLRALLTSNEVELDQINMKVDQTIHTLQQSRTLVKNLSSLSYHYYPHHLPNTNNARRLTHAPAPIKWNPQAPGAAMKAHKAAEVKAERDPATKVRAQALANLREVVKSAEVEHGILLGNIEKAW